MVVSRQPKSVRRAVTFCWLLSWAICIYFTPGMLIMYVLTFCWGIWQFLCGMDKGIEATVDNLLNSGKLGKNLIEVLQSLQKELSD